MGVLPDRHRRGVGRALLRHAEAALAASGVRFFQVKTLSAAHKDEGYGRTRAFYQSQGFQELEQHPTLWGEANPCLQMLKTLEPASEESDSGLQFSSVGSDQVSERLEVDMATLLGSCFEGYPPRAFYKQIPHRRWLCHAGDALVAVAGPDFRLMRCGDRRLRVTGIIDICVDKAYRARGIAANFLNAIEARATESRSDLLLLFADDHRLYKRAGYFPARNPVRLLALNKDRSHSVLSRPYPKSLMLKSLMEGDWDHEEELDLLGYLY
jgi:GNAT superfamily N-acetyltransferase